MQILACSYLALALTLWAIIHLFAEQRWFTTLLIYGPRWIWATPLLVLIPAAAFQHRRSLLPLLAATYVVVWPIMDLRLPWRRVLPDHGPGLRIRVLTCNTHGDAMNADSMAALIVGVDPDVVALEEAQDGGEVRRLLPPDRWHLSRSGDNWTASKFPIHQTLLFPIDPKREAFFAGRFELTTPSGPLDFYALHLASPHSVFSAALRARHGSRNQVERNVRQRLQEATKLAEDARSRPGPVLMAGDFNLPVDSTIYRQEFTGFSDAFSVMGFGFGWTYRVRWTVTRIDHILSNSSLRCVNCWVADNVGSPHRPLVADFVWPASKSSSHPEGN